MYSFSSSIAVTKGKCSSRTLVVTGINKHPSCKAVWWLPGNYTQVRKICSALFQWFDQKGSHNEDQKFHHSVNRLVFP